MWSKGLSLSTIRSAVQDGVREFSQSAFSEVQDGVKDSRRIVQQTSKRVVDKAGTLRPKAALHSEDANLKGAGSGDGSRAHPEAGSTHRLQQPAAGPRDTPETDAAALADARYFGASPHEQPEDEVAAASHAAVESGWPLLSARSQGGASSLVSIDMDSDAENGSGSPSPGEDTDDPDWGSRQVDDAPALPSYQASSRALDSQLQSVSQPSRMRSPAGSAVEADGSSPHGERGSQPQPAAPAQLGELAAVTKERDQLGIQLQFEQAKVEAAARERADLEASVAGLAASLEARMQALSGQLDARDSEVVHLREERETMEQAFDDMKKMLRQVTDERNRLAGDKESVEHRLAQASKESADLAVALEAARREAADTAATLAETRVALDKSAEDGIALGQAERAAMEARLHGALAEIRAAQEAATAADARAAAAEAARETAVAERLQAERLRRETEAQAEAAAAVAEAERSGRAEAQGLSEQLKAEGERRARVFNNAVKAAVSKIQRELEGERDALAARVQEADRQVAEMREEVAAAHAAADEARAEVAARTADAEAAGHVAVAAEEAAERAKARELQARQAAAEAEAARQQQCRVAEEAEADLAAAVARAESAEAEAAEKATMLAALHEQSETQLSELRVEVARWRSRSEAATEAARAAEARAEAAGSAGREASSSAMLELSSARAKIEQLEKEVSELRVSRAGKPFSLPTREDVLSTLGLDSWREERLLGKAADPESLKASAASGKPSMGSMPSVRGLVANSARKLARASKEGPGRGVISARTWLVIAYLAVLHLAVMVSFTRRNEVHELCPEFKSLPGT
ncbi:hypothetical protein WJX72_000920 [[Myrmecia] bisecta]|uniref:Uncharacterized protein n=1 Tax=[Myrmecia] bisecta TaxID=41462 RepID=A0AAW1QEM7_9CHLO